MTSLACVVNDMLRIYEEELEIPATAVHRALLSYLAKAAVRSHLAPGLLPVRFAVTEMSEQSYKCELGVVSGLFEEQLQHSCSIFDYAPRVTENVIRPSCPRGRSNHELDDRQA